MKKKTKLYLVIDNSMDQSDPISKEQKSDRVEANSLESETQGNPQQRASLTFEELSKLHPGRFIDGNAELESKGITAFIIPGMGMKPTPPETPIENEATPEDWVMFNEGEKALDAMMKRHEAIRKK